MPLNVMQASDSDGSIRNMMVHPANHQIVSNGIVVGVVQSFSPNESRTATSVFGLGVEGVVTTAISNYGGGTFTTPTMQIYDTQPLEAFGIVDRGGGVGGLRQLPRVKSLYQQRQPLDIRVVVYTPAVGDEILETYRNCWITSYSKTVAATSGTIGVNVGWKYEKVV